MFTVYNCFDSYYYKQSFALGKDNLILYI
jgi:hypothetical protein